MKLSCLNLKGSRFSLQPSASQDKALGKEVLVLGEVAIGHRTGQEGIQLPEEVMDKEAKGKVSEKEGNQEKAHRRDIAVLRQEAQDITDGLGKSLNINS